MPIMSDILHKSAKATHYNKEVEAYDSFNEKNSLTINQFIAKTLKRHKKHTVVDLACGTGSQVFYLEQLGFAAVGYDINAKMLKIARGKAKNHNLKSQFNKGDMRTTQAGQFDALVTIFNAIGHLTKNDFQKAIKNIYHNLNQRGLYMFDIFNLDYLREADNITMLTIDWLTNINNTIKREIQYSTIDKEGILTSYDIYHEQQANNKVKISKACQTLQVYSAKQLKILLEENGFQVLRQCNIDGSRFSLKKSERIMTVAQKR